MKTTKHTKKQILEAIAYWKKQLKAGNYKTVAESLNEDGADAGGKYIYVTKNNPSFKGMVRKIGASGVKKIEDPQQFEDLNTKLTRYSTCIPVSWQKAYQIVFDAAETNTINKLEQEFFDLAESMGAKRYDDKELFSVSDRDMQNIVDEFLAAHPHAFVK